MRPDIGIAGTETDTGEIAPERFKLIQQFQEYLRFSESRKMPPAGGVVVPVVVPETSLPLYGKNSACNFRIVSLYLGNCHLDWHQTSGETIFFLPVTSAICFLAVIPQSGNEHP